MNKKQKKIADELDHILGLCKCKPTSKCVWFNIIEKDNPALEQKKQIIKLIGG